jgi:YegS/Rv2252/BmrU family lipid kinase
MSRFKIILNPTAGAGSAYHSLPRIRELLTQYELEYDIVLTERPGHATELAMQAAVDGYDFIVAAGGDGTSNEVLNGLMQYKQTGNSTPVMGVIPIGRGNDFAFGANIPVGVEDSCPLLASHPQKWIDIGSVQNGDQPEVLYFGNGVGVGFDAVVGFLAARMKLKGMLSYLVAALQTIFIYFKPPDVQVDFDGSGMRIFALMVSVMNGRRMGGGFMMAPGAQMNDGLANLCIVSEVPQIAMFGLIGKFMKGTHESHPAVQTRQAAKITVTALKGTLPVHADGVTVCEEGGQISIELLPRALEIITRIDSA